MADKRKFTILHGTATPEEMRALEKAIKMPAPKKPLPMSLWRKSQIRNPLPKRWGTDF
jgi:hypothetical protein